MGTCLSWMYFSLLLSLLFFHSQFPFSSSSSSNSQSSALLHFNHSLSLHFILHFLVFVYLITHLDKNIYETVSHHIISYHIIYDKSWTYTPWLRCVASQNCRNFNKFLDFKNRYIHIFQINMTNQVMKESSISFTIIIVVSI